ncbi:MAG: chemotaxis response regulator protein-glutamate methylesterase [Clostridiales bacterium]|jgi:two-component system chemotaxis response regulator CheB|nr:chemotaxis response regulator protein-glutamate methylesterase [Clostridiales bacterium]
MIDQKIRVLIVDDSILFRETLAKLLSYGNTIEIVGKAGDAFEARDKILELHPDVMTLDVEMPKMNGIHFLKKLIPQYPIPTVICSSAPIMALDALDAGAVDYVKKPVTKTPDDMQEFANELKNKIITASQAKVRNIIRPSTRLPSIANLARGRKINDNVVIAMGTSTGGTDALQVVLKDMPAHCPPIIIVQHMPPVFTKMFAERLNKICTIEIKEAENGDRLKNGCALLAPGDFQMELKKDSQGYYVKVYRGEKVSGHCPSVNVLFDSVANVAGKHAIGVIMTGMGSDGATGLLKMRNAGAYTIGQNKETCVVYGMPMVAHNIGACTVQAPLEKISEVICKKLSMCD